MRSHGANLREIEKVGTGGWQGRESAGTQAVDMPAGVTARARGHGQTSGRGPAGAEAQARVRG